MKKFSIIIFLIVGIAFGFGLAYNRYSPAPKYDSSHPLRVVGYEWVRGPNYRWIEGYARNETDRKLDEAWVVFALYNKRHSQISTASDMVFNLEKGGSFKFRIVITDPEVVDVKVKETRAY